MNEMQSVLNLENVTTDNQGEYSCNATNDAGSYAASGIVVGECIVWCEGI